MVNPGPNAMPRIFSGELSVFNLEGKKLYGAHYHASERICLSAQLIRGVYLLRLENGDELFQTKLIIQ